MTDDENSQGRREYLERQRRDAMNDWDRTRYDPDYKAIPAQAGGRPRRSRIAQLNTMWLMGIAVMVFVGLCMVGWVLLFGGSATLSSGASISPSPSPSPSLSVPYDPELLRRIDVICTSQKFMLDRVKVPKTAEFPKLAGWELEETNHNVWSVTSYVDSQNEYGVFLRTHFTLKIRLVVETDMWYLDDIQAW